MNTVISVKVDKDVKEQASKLAKSAGLTLSALVNSYLRQVTATRRIDIYVPEEMTPKMEAIIAEVEKEIAAGQVSKTFDNVEDFISDLES